jgi:hypothetical protein
MKKLLIALTILIMSIPAMAEGKKVIIECKSGNNWLYVWRENTGWQVMEGFPGREVILEGERYIIAIGREFNCGSPNSKAEFKYGLTSKVKETIKFEKY